MFINDPVIRELRQAIENYETSQGGVGTQGGVTTLGQMSLDQYLQSLGFIISRPSP